MLPILAWNSPLISPIFLQRSLVFPILLFSSTSLHCSLKKSFLSFLAILWNSEFSWVYSPCHRYLNPIEVETRRGIFHTLRQWWSLTGRRGFFPGKNLSNWKFLDSVYYRSPSFLYPSLKLFSFPWSVGLACSTS